MTAPADHYPVPLDLVRPQANPNGLAFLLRAEMRGAVFKPVTRVWAVDGRWVAEITFDAPIGPERQQGLVIQLNPVRQAAA